MGKKLDRRFILSDNSLNRYGFRVMTEGLNIPKFRQNPVMLWMHMRDEGSRRWCDYKPIGHWEDIEVNEKGQLTASPYFDLTDSLSTEICAKVEEGTISATSIGFIPLTFSDDPKHLLPGQKRATVLKADLMEASFCDIPANANAVRLYSDSIGLSMDSFTIDSIPLIKQDHMKLKETMKALLAFLRIAPDKATETDLTEEQLSSISDEMDRLRLENDTLKQSLSSKDSEIATLKTSHETALTALRDENTALKAQVEALKQQPSETPKPQVTKEPLAGASSPLDELLSFCEKSDDHQAVIAKARELGVLS